MMDAERHNNTRVPLRIEDLRSIWIGANDAARLEILKSVIWTAPDNQGFYAKALKTLTSGRFIETLD